MDNKVNIASGASYVSFLTGRRSKGKQVKLLHDLVTVIAEHYAIRWIIRRSH